MPKVFLPRRCLAIRARTKATILHLPDLCAAGRYAGSQAVIWHDQPGHDLLEWAPSGAFLAAAVMTEP
ncbi:hypothetical protein CIT31_30500 [Mesorhizobium wenxiniae]|uniref:Uncharacterized protein n=1 Tax=Mesorhizobium wenxiniae TaxID=2014805 RepID=A0A271K7G7_9HYPH|nr:hypothetical protein CIT31_30500 [Mesorhizobium wenxiniae]